VEGDRVRRIVSAALASVVAMSAATLMPAPAAALTLPEIVWCVSAFAENPRGSACLAAVQSLRCSNRDDVYERDVQIDACTAASELASWSAEGLADIFIDRGTAYQVTKDRDGALADYSQAIRLNPEAAVAFYDRGLIYADKGDFDRAIADYSQAIRIDPKFASAFSDLGDAYRRKGDLDRAIADYSEAIRVGRAGDAAFSAFLAFYGRATAYRAKGDSDRAVADYSQANRLTPDTRAVIARGLTYLVKGDRDRAIADFSQVIEDGSEDDSIYLYRGIAHLYSGSLPGALADLNEAWAMSDGDDAYAALWLDIARQRGHLPGRLAKAAKGIDMRAWPAPVIRLSLGEMTLAAALTAADDPDANTEAAHLCDANFFAGELAAQRGAKDEAEPLLRRAMATGCGMLIAWAANAELKALGATPSNALEGRPVGAPRDDDEFERQPIMKYPPPLPAAPARQPRAAKTISL
jgi:lipoprotein NlpI